MTKSSGSMRALVESSDLTAPSTSRETHHPTMGVADTSSVLNLNLSGLNTEGLQLQRKKDAGEGGQTRRLTGTRRVGGNRGGTRCR